MEKRYTKEELMESVEELKERFPDEYAIVGNWIQDLES